jgi:dienelactone hydrolase
VATRCYLARLKAERRDSERSTEYRAQVGHPHSAGSRNEHGMGQAKQRGSKDEREAQAKAKVESIKPASIVCNQCQAAITEVHTMDTRGLDGIDGAFAGMCSCGHTTWAIAGDPNAVAELAASMEETMDEQFILGSMPRPTK